MSRKQENCLPLYSGVCVVVLCGAFVFVPRDALVVVECTLVVIECTVMDAPHTTL